MNSVSCESIWRFWKARPQRPLRKLKNPALSDCADWCPSYQVSAQSHQNCRLWIVSKIYRGAHPQRPLGRNRKIRDWKIRKYRTYIAKRFSGFYPWSIARLQCPRCRRKSRWGIPSASDRQTRTGAEDAIGMRRRESESSCYQRTSVEN